MKVLRLVSLACVTCAWSFAEHKGLLSQHTTGNALARGWKIVGNFKHSPLA